MARARDIYTQGQTFKERAALFNNCAHVSIEREDDGQWVVYINTYRYRANEDSRGGFRQLTCETRSYALEWAERNYPNLRKTYDHGSERRTLCTTRAVSFATRHLHA